MHVTFSLPVDPRSSGKGDRAAHNGKRVTSEDGTLSSRITAGKKNWNSSTIVLFYFLTNVLLLEKNCEKTRGKQRGTLPLLLNQALLESTLIRY